ERQLAAVKTLLERIDNHEPDVEEPDIEEVDFDDPEMESLIVGRRVKVLLSDVDRIRWRQDLREDQDRLLYLLAVSKNVLPSRDAKLTRLQEMIVEKVSQPINDGNR